MNLHERVLSVLACKYVDEVIIWAPYSVDDNVLSKVYKVDIVAHGNTPSLPDLNGKDPYEIPKSKGIYIEIENPSADLTTDGIIDRIIKHRLKYEKRQARKDEKAKLEAEAERLQKENN